MSVKAIKLKAQLQFAVFVLRQIMENAIRENKYLIDLEKAFDNTNRNIYRVFIF